MLATLPGGKFPQYFMELKTISAAFEEAKKEKKMKNLIRLSGLTAALILSVAPARAITGGVPDNYAHPNVGIMGVFIGGAPVGSCSCILIGEDVVLTAGHCIEYVLSLGEGVTVMVSFDEDPITDPGTSDWKSVDQLILHPDYNWDPSNPPDVGLLILEEIVTNILPAALPEEGFLDELRAAGELGRGSNRAKFIVVGYGATLTWPPPVMDLFPHPRQNAQSEFRALPNNWLRLSQNQATEDGGTCGGDSGGPVFWIDPWGDETLVAITSWGDPKCISTSFNYRVDIPETLDFIDTYLDGSGF